MVFSRLFKRLRSRDRQPKLPTQRRRLQLQRLANRELLAADLGVIAGTVYTDLANDDTINSIVNTIGATVNDPALNGVDVTLYRDNNTNGTLELAGGDVLVGTATTGVDGTFRFEDLSAGQYLLVQDAVAGLISPTDPVVVTVTDDDGELVEPIDDFSQDLAILLVADDTSADAIGSTTDASILGGNRVVILSNVDDGLAGPGGATVQIQVTGGQLQFDSSQTAELAATVQYDGDADGVAALNPTGLGGVDLVQGNQGAGLLLSSRADQDNGQITIRIYTDATNYSEATVNILNQATFDEFFVAFSDFTQVGVDGPADFENVGAVEFEIDGVPSLDGAVTLIGSMAPVEVTQNLANFEPVTLSGTLFSDNDNDGIQDGGEAGLTGVDVNLYADTDSSGDLDPLNDTLVDSTTTGVGGVYTFGDLIPGEYLVQIPGSEFTAGQPLFGYVTSTGNDPAADPDDDVDGDDNGTAVTGLGITTAAVTLISQGEPIDDGDVDPSTNTTVDFGVLAQTDLMIVKDLLTADPTAGGEATFRITVTNNGNSVANNLLIQDVLPAGLVFDRIENVSAGLDQPSVSGSTVTVTADALAINDSLSFDIIVTIPSSTTDAVIVNEATVTADEQDPDLSNNTDPESVPISIVTDLSLTKSVDLDTVASGGTLTYTLVVSNDGPSDATGVTVTDTLPAGVSFTSGDVGGVSNLVTADNGIVTAEVGDLAAGASVTITIVVAVAPNADDTLSNTATVTNTPDTDANVDNDTATAVSDVERQVDVQITKTASANPVAGGVMTFTFLVENTGPGDARGVTVTDTLNANYTFDSFDAGSSGVTVDNQGQDLTFTVGDLAANASATFTIDVLIDADLADGTSVGNTAEVQTTDIDIVVANDTSTVPVTVAREVDLTVTKDDNVTNGVPGQSIIYTITATNNGPSEASGVRIIDTLPAALTLISVNPGDTTFVSDNGVLTFTVGTLASGESVTVTVTAIIDSSASNALVNNVLVEGNETDSDESNNEFELQTTLLPQYDLVLTKTGAAQAAPGGNLTYTILVSNTNGPSDATGVVITDTLPAGVTFVSGTINNQAATVNGNQVIFNQGALAAGATTTARLTVAIAAGATGTLSNSATVTTAETETNTTNNTDTANTTLVPDVDLSVEKTVSAANAPSGTNLTYTVTVTNDGDSPATTVTAVDTLPAGVTFVSGTGPGGALSATGQVVNVAIGTLASGASATFTIVASINANASGQLTNNVTVATPLTETDSTNNTAQVSTTVDPVLSSIAGAVYVDTNNNGVRDSGESGIAGVTINLTGTDALNNAITQTTTTDANGAYLFDELPAGTYRVSEVQPIQFLDGQDTAGTIGGSPSNATVNNDSISQIILGADVDAVMFNFGELDQPFSKRRFLASTI